MAAEHHRPDPTGPAPIRVDENDDPERDLIWLILDGLRARRGAPTLAELSRDLAGRAAGEANQLAKMSLDYFADLACHPTVSGLLLGQDAEVAVRAGFAQTFGAVCYEREVERRHWPHSMGGLSLEIGR